MRLWRGQTLRVKLTMLYVGLLAAILLILGTILYLDNQRFLVNSLATRMRAQAKPTIEHWLFIDNTAPPLLGGQSHKTPPPDLERIAPFLARDLTSRHTGALVLDTEGKVLARGKRLPEEPDSPPPVPAYYRKALEGQKEISYSTRFQGAHVLVVLIPLKTSPESNDILGVVQISNSLAEIDSILFRQRLVLVVGIGIAVVLGTLLGLFFTTSTLKGLTKMVGICQAISAGDLGQRVGLAQRRDEIGRLSEAFDQMADRIQASFEAQKRLVANAAHELRTPLTALRGSLEVLLRGVQDDPAASARLIQGMYQDVRRLSSLCEQLLSISRLEASVNVQKRPLRLGEFLAGLLPQLKLLSRGQRVLLQKGPEVEIPADPDLLTQIVLNLFDNAAKHTPRDGEISLGWRAAPGGAELWLSDNGPGIDPGDLPHIFEPFFRGRVRSEDAGSAPGRKAPQGAGLGLALVKAIVTAHGGSITTHSSEGQGTVFTMFFPA